MTKVRSLKTLTLLILFLSLFTSFASGQEITLIDENLENNWPLFRDRLIGTSNQAIYFRMNESADLNLWYSDGTNENTKITGYLFEGGFSGTDVVYQASLDDKIAFGITGSSKDIILFENNSADYIAIETGLQDLEGLVILDNKLFYAASKTQTSSNTVFQYDLLTKQSSEFMSFDQQGVIAISTFQDSLLIMGYQNGANQLMTVSPQDGGSRSFFTFSSNPSNPRRVNMTNADSKVYFWYQNGASDYSLYVTDGTMEGTTVLQDDLDYYDEFAYITNQIIKGVDGKLVFRGRKESESSLFGALYFSDGSIENTIRIDFGNDDDTAPRYFNYLNNAFYFTATIDDEQKLMVTDGTVAGTVQLSPINVMGLVSYNNKLFTGAKIGSTGQELAYWDTNDEELKLAFDINSGFFDSNPREFMATDDKLFFISEPSFFDKILTVYTEELVSSTYELSSSNISISPNPASDFLNIDANDLRPKSWEIRDFTGKLVLASDQAISLPQLTTIDISQLERSIYTLIITDVQNKVSVEKFIKI